MSTSEKQDFSWGPATRAVHSGQFRSELHENSPALFLTSSYAFDSAAQAAAIFSGAQEGNVYSRFTNPSVTAFEERIAALEGGEKGLATASGMAAISLVLLGMLSSGDHLVMSRSVFGSTSKIASDILSRFGITTTKVALSNPQAWREAVRENTRMLFVETPANPTLEMVDLAELARLAREKGLWLVVDNVFSTPILQQPLALGADLVIHSGTKYLDGQGRVLGGVVVGRKELIMNHLFPFLRNTGPSLSPFNAWVLFKGMETLELRMQRHCDNAEAVAHALVRLLPEASAVHYPGLPHHPQHQLAKVQMKRFGGIVCLDLGDKDRAHAFIDALRLFTITANLGDSRSLVTHPATTTHGKLSAGERLQAGIGEGLVRLSLGLEDAADLVADLRQALVNCGACG
ncbi:MAG: O-succinylhomoserine sulfhydrylase [Magnetococcales bacterium]|nr:O-succinylhomoserine sulfhydrylase [Magnetococcales bacterium]